MHFYSHARRRAGQVVCAPKRATQYATGCAGTHRALLFATTLLVACDFSSTQPPAVYERRLQVLTAPSDGGVSLSWVALPGNPAFSVRWRAGGDSAWSERIISNRNNAFVADLPMGVEHTFIVATVGGGSPQFADTVVATPRERPDCSFPNYLQNQSYFCSRVAAEEWMAANGVSAADLRCRNEPVTDWGPDAPDCLYTTSEGFHMLLLREADKVFNPSAHPPTIAETREMLRYAIWRDRDPFHVAVNSSPVVLADAKVGNVNNYKSAQSFEFAGSGQFKSRVTRFTPRMPIPGRYAIFHEGHGASGLEAGADIIAFLLDRGWEVYSMDMPLEGENVVDQIPGVSTHMDFWRYEHGNTSIMSMFMLPVKQTVDFIQGTRPTASALLMVGRSGGGFTSFMYGALDPRITAVVSIAGGRPMSQRLDAPWGPLELGDAEQTAPEIFARLRYEDLMVAAGSRGGLFLYNAQDPCCFRVAKGDPFIDYLANGGVRSGREVRAFVDADNLTHGVGPAGFIEIDRFLNDMTK